MNEYCENETHCKWKRKQRKVNGENITVFRWWKVYTILQVYDIGSLEREKKNLRSGILEILRLAFMTENWWFVCFVVVPKFEFCWNWNDKNLTGFCVYNFYKKMTGWAAYLFIVCACNLCIRRFWEMVFTHSCRSWPQWGICFWKALNLM